MRNRVSLRKLTPSWLRSIEGRIRVRKRIKLPIVWGRLVSRAAQQGVSRDSLNRVYEYLRTRVGPDDVPRLHPQQNPSRSYFPGLRAKPIYDVDEIPWARLLEGAYAEIKRESLGRLEYSKLQPYPQQLTASGSWDVTYFYLQGDEVKQTQKIYPQTSAALRSCLLPEGPAGNVFFSSLSGQAHIKAHCGPSYIRLTCHLGLVVPHGARMRVGTETVGWQEGKCLIFDDSYEHEVWNDSDERRMVLLIQFWHPDLTAHEIWALRELRKITAGGKGYRAAAILGRKISDLEAA